MRVQHPDKSQYEIAPAGETPFLTDEHGVVEVSQQLGRQLLKQGWVEVKRKPGDPEAVAPAVEDTTDDNEKKEG